MISHLLEMLSPIDLCRLWQFSPLGKRITWQDNKAGELQSILIKMELVGELAHWIGKAQPFLAEFFSEIGMTAVNVG